MQQPFHSVRSSGFARLFRLLMSASALLTVAMGLVQVPNGLVQVLLPVELAAKASNLVVGIVAAANSVGFVIGCWVAPAAIRRIGHKRAYYAAALVTALATVGLGLGYSPWVWAVLRLAMGIAYLVLLNVVESWLVVQSTVENRGSVLSIYIVACRITMAAGQMLLVLPGMGALSMFVLSAVLYLLSCWPVAAIAGGSQAAAAPPRHRVDPRRFFVASPVAFLGCLVLGLGNTTVIGVGPAYLAGLGFPVGQVALLMTGIPIGSMILQWPMGRLSDRRDRRLVILVGAAVACIASVLIAAVGAASVPILLGLFTLWGGAALSLYAILVAHANDRVAPEDTVSVSSALLLAWAVGAAIGPLIASAAMEWCGLRSLFVYVALVMGGLAVFTWWRRRRFVDPR